MKKLFSAALLILTLSILLLSCTEDVVKLTPPDGNVKTKGNDSQW